MKKLIISAICIVLLCSHDLYLKTDSYFLKTHQNSEVYIFNGTFDKSENSISRDRIIESTITGPDYNFTPEDSDWSDKDKATHLKFKTEGEGTYLAGISTKARVIELSAEDFNGYLEHDGIIDVLEDRKKNGKLNNSARELYAKSAKVLLQVGASHSDDYNAVMGYPVEFIPLSNPYEAKVGDKISFKLLKEKSPLADQLVYVGNRATSAKPSAHGHTHDDAYLKTDKNGMVTIEIDHSGYWYLRTINMVESDKPDIEYVSNWGTLTFEIR
jgi:hypothetical protein